MSDGSNDAVWIDSKSIGVGDTDSITLEEVQSGDSASNINVEIVYDVAGLLGDLEVVEDSVVFDLNSGISIDPVKLTPD